MKLIIGCPVRDRAWILPRWFEHVEEALDEVQQPWGAVGCVVPFDVHYLFIGDPRTDRASFKEIDQACLLYGRDRTVIELDEIYESYKRVWNLDRFSHMVRLRNTLLRRVREMAPELYWSLDSDILVAPHTLDAALEALDTQFDAVGTKLYMTPKGTQAPSYAMLTSVGGLLRPDAAGVLKVDVIMASKVMTPKAYVVDYATHRQGEDIGWSIAARSAGCRLGWDGRHPSRHVMSPDALDDVDERVGF